MTKARPSWGYWKLWTQTSVHWRTPTWNAIPISTFAFWSLMTTNQKCVPTPRITMFKPIMVHLVHIRAYTKCIVSSTVCVCVCSSPSVFPLFSYINAAVEGSWRHIWTCLSLLCNCHPSHQTWYQKKKIYICSARWAWLMKKNLTRIIFQQFARFCCNGLTIAGYTFISSTATSN